MIRRLANFALSTALVLTALALPAPTFAAVPVPGSIAAAGDSITRAASTDGDLGVDAPRNSWSTGWNETVNSHYLRLVALNPDVTAHNHSVSGAKMTHLEGQIAGFLKTNLEPDYLTVLIGGNDLCTDTIDKMTPVSDFRDQFKAAMDRLFVGNPASGIPPVSPETNVYVVSIPDVHQLWELFKNNFFARAVWSAGNICQSLLANPTSNLKADQDRRAAFRQRNIDYNTQLAAVCSLHERCRFDANKVFDYQFARSDVSGDYFHPSIAGQTNLARVTWEAGYTWTTFAGGDNAPPSAGFTYSCTGLTCSFTDTSTDSDGKVVSWSWAFGDGKTSTASSPSNTYAAGGTYTVTLTVADDDDATNSTSKSVVVSEPSAGISLGVTAYKVKGTKAADLAWSGANGTNVDIHRDGKIVATTANNGAYTDTIGKGGGTHTYKVCEAGTTTCSPEVDASY